MDGWMDGWRMCVRACVCVRVCVSVSVGLCLCLCLYIYIYIYRCMYVYIRVPASMPVRMFIPMKGPHPPGYARPAPANRSCPIHRLTTPGTRTGAHRCARARMRCRCPASVDGECAAPTSAAAGEQPSIFVVNNYDAIVQALAEKVRSLRRDRLRPAAAAAAAQRREMQCGNGLARAACAARAHGRPRRRST
jgi:hypothetical protein